MNPLAGPVLTAAEMRAAEEHCGVPLDILMERAGTALAEAVVRFGTGQPVLVLCGPGNNGGDGYVAARLLAERGLEVCVAASGDPMTDLARIARGRWKGAVETLDTGSAPALVDCLFGTGLTRALDEGLRASLHRLARAARLTIAADMPSGIGSDDGADFGAAGADITLAFATAKPAHLLQPAAAVCGQVLVVDIGIDVASDVNVLQRPLLAAPTSRDNKYTRGMVAVIGGEMAGAGALAATAAARSGAGYVLGIGIAGDVPRSAVRRPHGALATTLSDKRLGAVVIGPGLGDDPDDLLGTVLASDVACVLDGARFPGRGKRIAPTILTPHAGEFARLFGEIAGNKIQRTREAAKRSGATVVFKGGDTVIASPGGRATLCPAASAWLSSAGTGDVLAGIAGAMLARGLPPHDAACAAVWLHGEAARRAGTGMIADDLCVHLPGALAAASA